ncbi:MULTISPECIES: hypothetical protein [unclassified Streptomyces]|uniref:hypothetical protein n=1 Tax=unclassified Streptomyces TaxID=2593676 RepID=UPI00087AE40D|nr:MULTISPECIES: hypothetical protein [unclassified Streptomyces]REH21973.1 hypothetical protein BX268_3823 [Streptomyces sp. 2221.1]SDT62524.1 hypothetical protein SAMN05428941_3814 [Streptomyces sp. 2114.2]
MDAVQSRRQATPGALEAFARFVLCGGGVGLAAGFAVAGLASWMPWALANALVTAASTLLGTELHARFTFGTGGRATWRQHTQSAGSAGAAYAVTCAAMLALHQVVAAPGAVLQQAVYLSAAALVGIARFVLLRIVVFARSGRPAVAGDAGASPRQRRVKGVRAAVWKPSTAAENGRKEALISLSASFPNLTRSQRWPTWPSSSP